MLETVDFYATRYDLSGKSNMLTVKVSAFAASETIVSAYARERTAKVVSLVTDSVQAIGVRAMFTTKRGSFSNGETNVSYEFDEAGYTVKIHRLPKYNLCHVVIVSKDPKLVVGEKVQAVGGYMLSNAIDTPIAAQWLPYLVGAIDTLDGIKPLACFGMEAYMVKFESKHIDKLVSDGIKCGAIKLSDYKLRATA